MASEQILLVEAEAKTRRMLQVSLEQVGYGVSTARDGAEALAQLDMGSPALVVCSTDLPKLDGYGLVRRMKNHAGWSDIPVIFMIAGESIEDKIRGLELGVDEYLHKPVFVRELLGRVQVLLARRMRDHLSESAAGTRVSASLADLAPIDLFESMESGRQTGVLRIRHEGRAGEVVFDRGEMIDARLKNLRGEEAVFRMLTWVDGAFEVELGTVDVERSIDGKTRAVIEAGIRHASEFQRLCVRLPALGTLLEVHGGQLVAMQAEIPDEINGILELVDGKRSIHDVIDDSPFDDLSTLATLAKLASEGLLVPVPPDQQRPSERRPAHDHDEEEAIYRVDTTRPPAVAARAEHEDPREWTRDLRDEHREEPPIHGAPGSELVLDEEPPRKPLPAVEARAAEAPAIEAPAVQVPAVQAPAVEDGANGAARVQEAFPDAVETTPAPSSRRAEAASLAMQQAAAALAAEVRAHESGVPPPEPASDVLPEATPRTAPTGTPADVSLIDLPKAPAVLAPSVLAPTVVGKVSLKRMTAPLEDVSTYTWLRDLTDGAPGPAKAETNEGDIQVRAPTPPSEPPRSEPAQPQEKQPDEQAPEGDDPLLSQTVKSKIDRAALEQEPSEATPSTPPIREEEAAPASGPGQLSESGVSKSFFSAETQEPEGFDDAIAPSSRDAPVFLSPEQIARKERGKKLVAMVVGLLGVGVVVVVALSFVRRDDSTPASSASVVAPVETAPPPPTAAPTASVAEVTTAAPSASATAEDDEELPDVDDPIKELTKLANAGQYNKAIPMGKAAIRKEPDNADGYYLLGQCYEAMGKTKEAREIYGECAAKANKGQYLSLCQSSAPK